MLETGSLKIWEKQQISHLKLTHKLSWTCQNLKPAKQEGWAYYHVHFGIWTYYVTD